jgi:hypothetical protein
MIEPALQYHLQTDAYNVKKMMENDEYKKSFEHELKFIDNYDSNLILIKYQKEKLNDNNYNTLGRFRSLIYDKQQQKVISYFPPKSTKNILMNYDSEYDFEEFFEGTMISLFWYDIIDDWEITTRSNIGAKCSFKPDGTTFRTLFLETLNNMNIELSDFDKDLCYTFVLQHNKNRIVTPIKNNRVILVDMFKCGVDNTIYKWKREDFYKMVPIVIKNKMTVPDRWKLEYKFVLNNLDKAPYQFMGYVHHNNGERIKFRNDSYEYVRHLKGNNPKIQYRYYHLRNNNLVKDYLKFFPEHKKEFSDFRNKLHKYTRQLFQCYISCYIKKEKPLKEYDYKFKTHMYYLHEKYKNELKTKGFHINMNEVINYINSLEPPRLMHVINSDLRHSKIEMDKIDIEKKLSTSE